ncbi:MAG: carbohydrate ABC transporter permease [Methylobacteriaceae bacterium]|nr:carbohydrate ABC transporter permease [Methylobacteriaceae bacterium]
MPLSRGRARAGRHALELPAPYIAGSYAVLVWACIVAIIPFLYVLSTSFKETKSLFSYPPDWIPRQLYYGNYSSLFAEHPYLWWMINTFFVSLCVTAIKLVIDSMAAYALAKMQFAGKKVVTVTLLLSVAIPGTALLIPLFLIARSVGLLNTYGALILPPLANPLGIFMLRSFITSLPADIEHSARLEGASEMRIFLTIILPLIGPGLVVHAIFIFLMQYTSFIWPLIAVHDISKQVLTVGISSLKAIFTVDWGLISAASLVATLPIIVAFVLLQRYFIAQSLAGALKE